MIRYYYIEANRGKYPIAKMVRWAKVSRSGFYAWLSRKPSSRDNSNDELLSIIRQIHEKSNKTYGSVRMVKELRKKGIRVNHKRVERIMKENNIHGKARRKYKATTYSDHDMPVAENILNRNFSAKHPGKKMVSDITYIPTDEGWLYLAGVMDLCGRKMVGVAMDGRMTKKLVMAALQDAIHHTRDVNGCILHSDRGSQYCSKDYCQLAKQHGFTMSMSRKGNCWDNAPMESFWGTLKQEWLNEKHFRTRSEAKAAVFEYIWIFYNRQRIHSSNNYQTPEEYYMERIPVKKIVA